MFIENYFRYFKIEKDFQVRNMFIDVPAGAILYRNDIGDLEVRGEDCFPSSIHQELPGAILHLTAESFFSSDVEYKILSDLDVDREVWFEGRMKEQRCL